MRAGRSGPAGRGGRTRFRLRLHLHPWVGEQGHSLLAWTVLGGIARATTRVRVGTAVTCPTMRYHPAIVAQAAATAASGENLNEHVVGRGWPAPYVRLDMLAEAVALMRRLGTGEMVTHRGPHYTVEHARRYTLPDQEIEVVVAASKPMAAALAGRIGDGMWDTAPSSEQVEAFRAGGDGGRPVYGGPKILYCTCATSASTSTRASPKST